MEVNKDKDSLMESEEAKTFSQQHGELMVRDFLQEHQATDDIKKLADSGQKKLPKSSRVITTATNTNRGAPDVLARMAAQKEEGSLWDRIKGKDAQQLSNAGKKGKSHKFRSLVRMIKTNLQWTRNMHEKNTEDTQNETFVVKVNTPSSTGHDTLTFDASQYKVKDRTYGGLTTKARKILLKHPLERTEEQLITLRDVVDRLKCFMKYPSKVKREIARVIFYENYTDGRIIIQQGHVGQSFYFIVSGKVDVATMKVDPNTGQKEMQVLGELTEGSTFGELALLHNVTRTATIVCKGNSEFLRVDKEDFEAVLRASYEREWNERLKALGWLDSFSRGWTPTDLANFNNFCSMKEYSRDEVVYGNTTAVSDNIYFVISGECLVIRQITLVKEISNRTLPAYRLPTKHQLAELLQKTHSQERRSGTMSMLETKYWNIGTMGKGFYFGVGENMKDTYIISRTKLELLVVPRVQFKPGRAQIVERMKEELEMLLPSNETLYRLHYDKHVWNEFKQQMTEEIAKRNSIPKRTKVVDVPVAIRNYHGYTKGGTTGPSCRLLPPINETNGACAKINGLD